LSNVYLAHIGLGTNPDLLYESPQNNRLTQARPISGTKSRDRK